MTNPYDTPSQYTAPAPSYPPPASAPRKNHTGLKVVGSILGILVLIGIFSAPRKATPITTPVVPVVAQTTAASPTPTPTPTVSTPAAPVLSVSQTQAVRKAQTYLSVLGFSRTGLIKQLEFDGFSKDDATYAVDHITVDWSAQAAKKARAYLNALSFSRAGLIKQLKFDGFTPEQAAYGATFVGL